MEEEEEQEKDRSSQEQDSSKELMNLPTLHDASKCILSTIRVLLDEPTDLRFVEISMTLAGVHLMSASDNARLLDNVCEASQQLADVRERLWSQWGQMQAWFH